MLMFQFLWLQKWDVWEFLITNLPDSVKILPRPADDFWNRLYEQALQCDIPQSEEDREAVEALEPFLDLADSYTALYVYGLEDGLYRAGRIPEVMNETRIESFFRVGYLWTNGAGEQSYQFPLRFKNGTASVIVNFYHSSRFVFPYFIFCLFASIFCFFAVILFFVGRKLKAVVRLEQAVLNMSSGDLETPVPQAGKDEVGILAKELDQLRAALSGNFEEERKIRKANQELMAALSHDLRTPLTILKGYLEILRLNRSPAMQEEYALRCIQKTEDIQEMTERMFEYALVYDQAADKTALHLCEFPLSFFLDILREHADFLHLAGFSTETRTLGEEGEEFYVLADGAMAKRVFGNLFSNIIKYAEKKEDVVISVSRKMRPGENMEGELVIALENRIRTGSGDVESTRIGLNGAGKLMECMKGKLEVKEEGGRFEARLFFQVRGAIPPHLKPNAAFLSHSDAVLYPCRSLSPQAGFPRHTPPGLLRTAGP